MKTRLIATLFAMTSFSVYAETFTCVFTEPFISFTYSTSSRNLVRKNFDNKLSKIRRVDFEVSGPNTFVLKKNNAVVAKLVLDQQGSDGMSDFNFPYSVEFEGLFGGCESTVLKKKGLETE